MLFCFLSYVISWSILKEICLSWSESSCLFLLRPSLLSGVRFDFCSERSVLSFSVVLSLGSRLLSSLEVLTRGSYMLLFFLLGNSLNS